MSSNEEGAGWKPGRIHAQTTHTETQTQTKEKQETQAKRETLGNRKTGQTVTRVWQCLIAVFLHVTWWY